MRTILLAALLLPLAAQAHPGKAKHAVAKPRPKVELVGRAVGQAAAPVIVPLSGQAKAVGGAR